MTSGHWHEQKVGAVQAGLTLEQYLREVVGVSRRRLQRLTRIAGIKLNGRKTFLARILKVGDIVAIRLDRTSASTNKSLMETPPIEVL